MSVVVFGSINMDLVVRTPRFPKPGETLTGHDFFTAPGGKGANQAVAAARLGIETVMVGRVGADVFGGALLDSLNASGVDTARIFTDPEHPSGTAVITVDDCAENEIVIVPGANGAVGLEDILRLKESLQAADCLLLQLEIPMEAVAAAAAEAHRKGVTTILDPAPAKEIPAALYQSIDYLTPNEVEASILTGNPVQTFEDAGGAARILQARGVPNVIIKMGGKGVFWRSAHGEEGSLPAFAVKAVDTVAAGDAFNGAFAAALSEGKGFLEALRWGMAGGAVSTTRKGAQPSMPDRSELLALLNC